MARVVVATAPGGPEVLAVVDQPVGAPGPGEARVEVRAAGINPIDWKFYSPAMGAQARYPMRLGFEAAGVVTEVGPDATGPAGTIAVGDEVIAYSVLGGYADELTVAASTLVPKPAELTWEAAGGLILAGVTAVHALVAAKVGAGETLLVHAASGGVGLMAVQVAVARGVRTIGTSSERNHEYLRELGVEPVAYGDGLAERVRELAPEGVDAAIDCVGTDEAVDVSLELVGDRDRIVTIVRSDRALEAGLKLLGNGPGADPGREIREAARMELVELVRQGKLEVRARAFAFDDAAQAHREGMAGHVVGKLVLVPEVG